MALGDTRVIHSIQCVYKKKGTSAPSTARPVKVTITPGKITITSLEDKFEPFTLKTSDFINTPKAPRGKRSSWVTLDCIQHSQAKFQFINFKTDEIQVGDLVEALRFAWPGNNINSSAVFADDADQMMVPVHKPLPNAANNSYSNQANKNTKNDHPSFPNDFNSSKREQTKPVQKASKLQGLFDNSIKEEVKPEAVHTRAGLNKLLRESAAKQPSKKSTSECLPPVTKKVKLSEAMETVKEYKEIEKEFVLLAEKVFRLEKKGREDVVNLVKEIVEEAVKSDE